MTTFYTYIAYFKEDTFQSIGVTSDLKRRFKLLKQIGSKKQSSCCKLVYYEEFQSSDKATKRENELLELHETVLNELVEEANPMLVDLLESLGQFI